MSIQLTALTTGVESYFRQVQATRMADVPIINPALEVQTVGFHHTEEGCLGVLITPWFISLMLLPCEGDDWQELAPGSSQTHYFPAGEYDFLLASDPVIGRYQSCSLLSPVLQIQDQETAVAFAEAALAALMQPTMKETARSSEPDPRVTDAVADKLSDTRCNRRNFLRGQFRPKPCEETR